MQAVFTRSNPALIENTIAVETVGSVAMDDIHKVITKVKLKEATDFRTLTQTSLPIVLCAIAMVIGKC